jgi:ADP-ribose pyrophosphatase
MPEPSLVADHEVYSSQRFRLSRESWLTVDGQIERPVIHHPGAVAVIAVIAHRQLLMVRQFRYPIRRWTLEIPAGTRVQGEAPEVTATRELREESGWSCASLRELSRMYPAVGVSDEELILYRADGLHPGAAAPEPGELVAPEIVPFTALRSCVERGEICDAKTLFALHHLGISWALSPSPTADAQS